MEYRKRISVALIFIVIYVSAVKGSTDNLEGSSEDSSKKIEKRSGFYGGFHSGLSYSIPHSGFAYSKPWITPVVKYHSVIKPLVAASPIPVIPKPHYHIHHGGATVHSYQANYPRYPLYKPVYKIPVHTVVKPTVFTSPGVIVPQKPIIPIAVTPSVVPTIAKPIFVQRPEVFNPTFLAGLNPQLIPVSVAAGNVFTGYPNLAAPIQPTWKPIVVPSTVAAPIPVQRPSIAILPPTVATPQDHGHHHHHLVASTASSALIDHHHHHDDHHHHLISGQGEVSDILNHHHHTASAGAYVGPSSYDVDIHPHHSHYHSEAANSW